jgi:ATPase subunit of ABC transporter with duplicated ATPase domains
MKMDLSRDMQYQTQALAQMMARQNIVVIDRANSGRRLLIDACQSKLEDDQQDLEPQLEEVRQKEQILRRSVGKEILQELHFETQTERYEAVHDAHAKTFGWIFQKKSEETLYDCFVTWLESGEDLYWINGKAGSGKSTLMRYICDNPRTKEHLLAWSGDDKLVTADFYFWNIGNRLQKSQLGLLRSLLYQVLEHVPDLIPILFPRQWATKYASRSLEQDPPVCISQILNW